MPKSVIVVEGCADAVFINDLIFSIAPSGYRQFQDLNKFKEDACVTIQENPHIEILISGGCTKIINLKSRFEFYRDAGYKILVIQDADSSIKDPKNGGFKARQEYLGQFKKDFKLVFESFLLPDDKNDGDLETVLLEMVNKKKFEPFINNYTSYSEGVKKFSKSKHAEELLEPKYQVFNYCQVYNGAKFSNEKLRDYKTEYWDFECELLNPLKDFLRNHLNVS